MADKKELAARVLELVGGADNVVMATHCITRLRFNLKDDSKADLEALKTLDGALGAQVKDGQWQVIIGASVGSVYDELEPMLGDRMGGEVSADAEQPELQKGSARVFDIITGIFSAIIPALVAGGIVKGILAAIAAFGIDTGAGDFAIFNMISDIPFYFLPFLLAMSTADKFRVNRSLALCVAGSLMYPTIVNAVGTGETPLALFGFTVPIFSYADSVFPVIFGVIGLSFVYRAIDKVVPDLFKLVVVPALSLAIVIPVNLFVLAPIGAWCGLGLANGIVWLFSTLGPVAGFLLGFFMPLIVLFGMHQSTSPIQISNIATLGYDYLLLFTVQVPNRTPLIAAMIADGIGGALTVVLGAKCFGFVMPGITSLPVYADPSGNPMNLIMIVVCIALTWVISAALSFALYGRFDKK